jgi:hypothetical protein
MHEFKAGDKVVCIQNFRNYFDPKTFSLVIPEYRQTYTVRDVIETSKFSDGSGLGILLVEIVNHQRWCNFLDGSRAMIEPSFSISAFRPQVYESTMQLFYDILAKPERHIGGHSKLDVRYENPPIKKNGSKE